MVDLTFGAILKAKVQPNATRMVALEAKKSSSREVAVSTAAYEAVLAYQKSIEATDSTVMFPGGEGSDPANKWVKRLTRFFKKHELKV